MRHDIPGDLVAVVITGANADLGTLGMEWAEARPDASLRYEVDSRSRRMA